jgi:hypothetical protein
MAYPMMPWPTFADFRARLVAEFGCTYKELPGQLSVNGCDPETVCYLERKVEDEMRRYAVVLKDDERVAPSVIRSICARLELDPRKFGLTLG